MLKVKRILIYLNSLLLLISLMILTSQNLYSADYKIDFSNDTGMEYDRQQIEVYNGKLRLSPTGWFWTNSEKISALTGHSPYRLYKDSKGNLFYSYNYLGAPPYKTLKSSDNGISWTNVLQGAIHTMIEGSDKNLYCITAYGKVCKSYDNGDSWSNLSLTGPDYTFALMEDSNKYFYVTKYAEYFVPPPTRSSNYLWRSMDYGTNWELILKENVATSLGRFYWLFELKNGNFLSARTNICISTDHGTNWSILFLGSYRNNIFRANDNSIYAFGDDGIIRSQNEGQSWEEISNKLCWGLIETDTGLFFRASYTNIWRSYDKGYTWQKTPDIIMHETNFGLYSQALIQGDNGKIYAGGSTNYSLAGIGYVFRSGYPLNSEILLDITPNFVDQWQSFTKSDTLNNGMIQYEFIYSTDNGNTWSSWQELNDANLQAITCSATEGDQLKIKITLSSYNRDTTPEIDWINIKTSNKLQYQLFCNYPNPFDPNKESTCIEYLLSNNEDVKLLVYSIDSKITKDWKFTKGSEGGRAGINRIFWDGRNNSGYKIANGVYFCYLKYPGTEKMIKILVIK
ncbi:MAG: hypothetical protein KKH98_15635 [Spirochaetes bacterium]|nr:hypothetical protein [Spirochaetota bacterium]